MRQATISLIMVKSCNELLRMLLICILSYLKSVLGYKFLILDSYHPNAVYLREQGYEDPWSFLEAEWGREQKRLGNIPLETIISPVL
jgi:hypothetical protein